MLKGTMRKLVLMAVVAGVLALFAGQALAGGGNGLDRAIAAQEHHTNALLAHAGVVGTAVGIGANGQAVVKVYTERGGVANLPAKLDGVVVEIEVTGELVAQSDPQASFSRPVPIGVSTGTERLNVYRGSLYCSVGTLGARLTDGTNVWALSNAHVFALEGAKTDGAVQTGTNGDRILQPGRADMAGCGSQAQIDAAVIGNLADYRQIEMSRRANNTVDAAIASTTTANLGNATPADDGYGTPNSTTASAYVGQAVQKYGRTTGRTYGAVTGINATVIIRYDNGQARFINQIIVTGDSGAFSDSGDSGSLIVTNDGNNSPVALLFAGSSSTTIGNPIDVVLAEFGLTIDGSGTPSPTPTPGPTPVPTATPVPTPTSAPTATPPPTSTPVPGSGPDVAACSPSSASNRDQIVVSVTGSGFVDGANADFGTRVTVQGVTFVSDTQLDVQVKVHPKAASGPRDVTVTNPDSQSGTNAGCFSVN